MKGIRKMFEKFEKVMSAAAFAEAGEFDTAREIMRDEQRLRKQPGKRINASLAANSSK
jgi:hypothetical protein